MREAFDSFDVKTPMDRAIETARDMVDTDELICGRRLQHLAQWVVDALDYVTPGAITEGPVTVIRFGDYSGNYEVLQSHVDGSYQINVSARREFSRDQLRCLAAAILQLTDVED